MALTPVASGPHWGMTLQSEQRPREQGCRRVPTAMCDLTAAGSSWGLWGCHPAATLDLPLAIQGFKTSWDKSPGVRISCEVDGWGCTLRSSLRFLRSTLRAGCPGGYRVSDPVPDHHRQPVLSPAGRVLSTMQSSGHEFPGLSQAGQKKTLF